MVKLLKNIHVRRKPGGKIHEGLLNFNKEIIPCNLGRSGITRLKKEGDGATPAGQYAVLYGFFRADRIKMPASPLSLSAINKTDGWCDAPDNPNYNSLVKLPFKDSHEVMMRGDRLYDICIVLDYNISPCISGRGSAIFFHQTSIEGKPTEGCVAIAPEHMAILLPMMSDETNMIIHP